MGQFIGAVGDGGYDNNRQTILLVTAEIEIQIFLQWSTSDLNQETHQTLTKPIYFGELDVANVTTTIDSTNDTTAVHGYKWGFPSKIRTSWDGSRLTSMVIIKRLLVSFSECS